MPHISQAVLGAHVKAQSKLQSVPSVTVAVLKFCRCQIFLLFGILYWSGHMVAGTSLGERRAVGDCLMLERPKLSNTVSVMLDFPQSLVTCAVGSNCTDCVKMSRVVALVGTTWFTQLNQRKGLWG